MESEHVQLPNDLKGSRVALCVDAKGFPAATLSDPTDERRCITVNLASHIAIADVQGPPVDAG